MDQKTGNEMPDCGTVPKNKNTNTAKVKKEEDNVPVTDKVKVKKEEDDVPVNAHEYHTFTVKFKKGGRNLTVECKQPSTVLEAIKSFLGEKFKYITWADEKLLIKLGDIYASPCVPTHFPCSCVEEGECLTITTLAKPVEAKNPERYPILPKERYSIFSINKEGGENTKSKAKEVFRETHYLSKLEYFCVYGEKGTTVEEALKRDGRFVEGLTDFELSDENKPETFTMSTQTVNNLHDKKFKICLSPKKSTEPVKQPKTASKNLQSSKSKPESEMKKGGEEKTNDIIDLAAKKTISLGKAMKEKQSGVDLEEINELLRKQFPDLKQWMESRFPGKSFQEELELKKENFGKIQQSFSEVHRIELVLKRSESVCRIMISVPRLEIKEHPLGTGFVLFDNFVLTNRHLFDAWITEGSDELLTNVSLTAQFHFKKPGDTGLEFPAKVIFRSDTLDFALLKLDDQKKTVPPGLLEWFWSPPKKGEACIVGHPGGGVKRLDPTCVIEKNQRGSAVRQNLAKYKIDPLVIYNLNQCMQNDPYADICVTYNTSMYHYSSGSPVFDSFGQVFGLHSGSFLFDYPIPGESVIEYCYPLLYIFKELVGALKVRGSTELLLRIQQEAKGNQYLENILASVLGTSGHVVQTRQDQEEGNEGESQGDTRSVEEMEIN
ncbi:serine protease FAM111A-like [Cololabis saira]|uniref:serine protease FAM111A-like n=1 Tax=Cololabis saira TaxID=129043 RepID=UPI002AD220E1|nr:serine protease FAM111A-like [Cololabis saira]XP_061566059.1 serine protease FAM111A-like [Cololabis saira]